MRKHEITYRSTDKGKLTRKVHHFKERFKAASLDEIRQRILGGIGGWCPYCQAIKLTVENCSADHKDPIALLGTSDIQNMIICCKKCNRSKGDLSYKFFMALLRLAEKHQQKENLLNKLARATMVFGRRAF